MSKQEKEAEILEEFYQRLDRFIMSSAIQQWRATEIREHYRAIAGDAWEVGARKERERKGKPVTAFNGMSRIVRAISGNEIMNRSKITYYARKQENDAPTDIMSDAVEYIQNDSGFYTESSLASEDTLICGLGATVSYINYDNPEAPYGESCEERIFPAFLLYDNQVRGRNLNKRAKWAGYCEIVSQEWLRNEIKEATGTDIDYSMGDSLHSRREYDFIEFFEAYSDRDEVDVLFHYEWMKPETIYRVKNPFSLEMMRDGTLAEGGQVTRGALIANASAQIEEEYGVDLSEGAFVLTASQYREYKAALQGLTEMTGYEFDSKGIKSQRNKYYKARIAAGMILDWQESWTQGGFTITYKTGYYDERRNHFYGIVRDMLPVQRALNIAVSDYISYLQSCPKGGMYIEETATLNLPEFIQTRANEQEVTVLRDGGLTRFMPKETPQSPTGLSEFISFCETQLLIVAGLPPSFLAAVDSGNMTSVLYGKLLKQAYMVLAHFFDSNRDYLRRKGRLFIDEVQVLAENNNGRMLRRMSNQTNEEAYIALDKDKLSAEYDIVIGDRPLSDEEKQENFNMKLEAAKVALPFGINLLPFAFEDYTGQYEDKEKMIAMMQPPPPPEPDPLQQEMLKSQIAFQYAEAENRSADAEKKRAETQLMELDARLKSLEALEAKARERAEIEKIESQAMLNRARAGESVLQTVKGSV